ncbi:MAG: tetratricopeptide repeat protein [Leptolyngbyaceae cyanobacterium]|mgnify:CR=1 FL=1
MGSRKRANGQRWLAIVWLGSLSWLGWSLPVRSQPQQCFDEISYYQRNRVTERADWSDTALNQGHIQPAVEHLTEGLEQARTIDVRTRASILENFIETNSASTGWLARGVDQLIALEETDAARTVLDSATPLAQGMPNGYSALKIRFLTTIAVDYGSIGDQTTALELLSQAQQIENAVQGAEFKTNALITIAQGYSAVGEKTLATDVATQALQQAETVNDTDTIRRDRTVGEIATVYAEAGELDRAIQLAQTIEQLSFRENVISAVAISAARSGQLDQATSLVRQLTLDQLTIQTLKEIGLYLTAQENNQEAQLYFDQAIKEIETHGYPGFGFTDEMLSAGLAKTAWAALTAAPEGRMKADGLMEFVSYYTEAGDTATAREALQQAMTATNGVDQDYAQQELWEEILKRAIELEEYDLALSTVETLVDKDLTFNEISDYTRVAIAAAKSGQIDVALGITERIDPSYGANLHRVWSKIAVAHAAAGDFDAAFAMAEKTNSPYGADYAKTLASIGLQQQKAGLLEESATTMERAVQTAAALDYVSEQLIALNSIAIAQTRAGFIEPAGELLDQVLAMIQAQTSDSADLFTLQTVAEAWVEIEAYEAALRVMDAIAKVQPDSPLWKTLLVEPLIDQGDYATALDMIESRDESVIRDEELMRIAERSMQAGQTTQTLQILNHVYNASNVSVDQLLRISELYSHMGQTEQILPILDQAFEIAKTIPGDESQVIYIREDLVVDDTQDRGSLYEEVAVAYARAGAFEQGVAVVEALQDSDTREQAMARLNCYRDF